MLFSLVRRIARAKRCEAICDFNTPISEKKGIDMRPQTI